MHNNVYLIGRLTTDPEVKEYESGKDMMVITLAVQRNYKNEDGVYDTDFIRCSLWNAIASNVGEYCKKGDLVGVKGRIQTNCVEDEETKEKKYYTDVIVERVSFLASKKEREEADS